MPRTKPKYPIATHSLASLRRFIAFNGPTTIYQAKERLKVPVGTVFNDFRRLERVKEIRLYNESKTGRKRKEYGLTFHGFMCALGMVKMSTSDFSKFLKTWQLNKEFKKEFSKLDLTPYLDDKEAIQALFDIFQLFGASYARVAESGELSTDTKEGQDDFLQKGLDQIVKEVVGPYFKILGQAYVKVPALQAPLNEVLLDPLVRLAEDTLVYVRELKDGSYGKRKIKN